MFKDLFIWILKFLNKNIDKDNKEDNVLNNYNEEEILNKQKEEQEKELKKEIERIKKLEEKQQKKIKKELKEQEKELKRQIKENKKSFLLKKRKKEKNYGYITVFFSLSFLILMVYLISFTVDLAFSKEEFFIATISKRTEPYVIKYTALVRDYEPGNEIGDILELNNESHPCINKNETCFKYIIKDIRNNKVYLDFNDFTVPRDIPSQDFEFYSSQFLSKKSNYVRDYKIYGKISKKKFIITKIEVNSN